MARQKRQAAIKVTKYIEDGDDDDDDDEQGSEHESTSATGASDTSGTRTKRGDGKRRKSKPAEEVDEDFEDSHEEEVERPAAKNSMKTKGKSKGRQGRLAYFSQMPLDILSEICSHLDPITLLYMARTCKSVRGLLMSRSSRSLWIAARRTVFLPDLQAWDFSEPAYASLVFEKICHVCGKPRASIHSYALRARFCKACQKANYLNQNQIRRAVTTKLHPKTYECSLYTLYSITGRSLSGKEYYFLPDVLAISDKLVELQSEADLKLDDGTESEGFEDDEDSNTDGGDESGAQKEVEDLVVGEEDEAQDGGAEEPGPEGESEYERFIRLRKKIRTSANADAAKLNVWDRSSAQSRASDARDKELRRRKAIEDKLLTLGYSSYDISNALVYGSEAFQPRDLTDRIWASIGPGLIKKCDECRDDRLAQEANDRLRARRNLLKPYYLVEVCTHREFPTWESFCSLPSIKKFYEGEDAMVDQTSWDAIEDARETEVVEESKRFKMEHFVKLVKASREARVPILKAIDEQLTAGVAPDALVVDDEQMDRVFSRFSFHWSCGGCIYRGTPRMPYPTALRHFNDSHSYGSLSISWKYISAVHSAVVSAELDDFSVSAEDLEYFGASFECVGCKAEEIDYSGYPYKSVPVKSTELTFPAALQHVRYKHNEYSRGNDSRLPTLRLCQNDDIPEAVREAMSKGAAASSDDQEEPDSDEAAGSSTFA